MSPPFPIRAFRPRLSDPVQMAARQSSQKIDVARVVEIVLDSTNGGATIRFKGTRSRLLSF